MTEGHSSAGNSAFFLDQLKYLAEKCLVKIFIEILAEKQRGRGELYQIRSGAVLNNGEFVFTCRHTRY